MQTNFFSESITVTNLLCRSLKLIPKVNNRLVHCSFACLMRFCQIHWWETIGYHWSALVEISQGRINIQLLLPISGRSGWGPNLQKNGIDTYILCCYIHTVLELETLKLDYRMRLNQSISHWLRIQLKCCLQALAKMRWTKFPDSEQFLGCWIWLCGQYVEYLLLSSSIKWYMTTRSDKPHSQLLHFNNSS